MEDFEEGLTCYRNSIRLDPRHYNAWWVVERALLNSFLAVNPLLMVPSCMIFMGPLSLNEC
jgi:hypothetical protein